MKISTKELGELFIAIGTALGATPQPVPEPVQRVTPASEPANTPIYQDIGVDIIPEQPKQPTAGLELSPIKL